jgi:hypothetical protein
VKYGWYTLTLLCCKLKSIWEAPKEDTAQPAYGIVHCAHERGDWRIQGDVVTLLHYADALSPGVRHGSIAVAKDERIGRGEAARGTTLGVGVVHDRLMGDIHHSQ